MNENKTIENISIYKIIPNIYQPRIKFDEKSITELANSIKKHGIIQPLILRKAGNLYEIIDGERRYRAAKKIGLKEVPSIILNITEQEIAELILTENMQKQLLTPIEEANAYQQIMILNKLDIDELSKKLGKSKNDIENKLKLLTLSQEIQTALLNNKISEGHARVLSRIDNKEKQLDLFKRVLNERLPVRILEEIIDKEINLEQRNEKNNKKDAISLNELNKTDFLNTEKKNKLEENKMDNTQMNFNQYNSLLKEKEKPEMGVMAQPEPILGNIIKEPKPNDFFPSLEEQPLNIEVPINNQIDIPTPVEMPQFEVPNPTIETPMQEPTMQQPVTQATETIPMPEVPTSVEMPQFEVPNPTIEMPIQAPTMQQPVTQATETIPMPEVPTSVEMPQFEVPNPTIEMPIQAPTMQQPVTQVTETILMPEVPTSVEMPQFEVPNPTIETPMQTPTMQQPVITNIMPAVNMIRNIIPLLENSGYKIDIEESDNQNEYQITLKVKK